MATLNTQVVAASEGAPERWLVMLHGIFGAGRNWNAVARALTQARPEWGVVLVDLREHGRSQGFPPPHTLERTAGDLAALEVPGPIEAVLGHSFGGKVALLRAQSDETIRQAWIVDSTPAARSPDGGPWKVLRLLRRLPSRFEDRDSAVATLVEHGLDRPVALWLTTNLERREGAYVWRLDLDAMDAMLSDFYEQDLWGLVEEPRPGLVLHFLRATGSAVLDAGAIGRIRAAGERTGRVFLHDVRGGHWLNGDNPDAVVELLTRGLD